MSRTQDEGCESSTLTDGVHTLAVSDACPRQEGRHPETSGPRDQLCQLCACSYPANENEEVVIAAIRATDVALGLRRLRVPAGFYVMLHHNSLEWRTENKPSSVNNDVVEWSGPIPISSDMSATTRLEVYASLEFQPMLGSGEQHRRLTTTVGQLLDRSTNDVSFMFTPKDGDVVSPCSSFFITVKQQKRENASASTSKVLCLHWLTTESRGELEDATNHGHSALSRYRKHGEKQYLEHSIQEFERALNVCPVDHPCRAAAQCNLALAKSVLHQVEDRDTLLEDAVRLYRDALAVRPVDNPDRPSTLIQLATIHFTRSQKQRDYVEDTEAERLLDEVLGLESPDSHENQAAYFIRQLHDRRKVGLQSDGPSSVEQRVTSHITSADPGTSSYRLLEHYQRFGDLADLQQVIGMWEELVQSISIWDTRYPPALSNLAVAFWHRFNHLGELADLEDAILRARDAIDLYSHKLDYLSNLGSFLQARFKRLGQLTDLEDAISNHRDAVDLTPHGHPPKSVHLSNLGSSLYARFKRFGQLTDLEEALSRQGDAVDLTPHGHPHKSTYLNNLGISLITRFEHLGQLTDLEEAISRQRDAVDLTPHGDPRKSTYLNNLGSSLITRFERLGQLTDLEDAISRQRDAVDLIPHGHRDKPTHLISLGTTLITRFERLGQLTDLEDAVSSQRDAVNLTPHGDPHRCNGLDNLGTSLITRFKRLGQLTDLEEAISMQRDVVDLTPHGHPDKPRYLNNLGIFLITRFEDLGQLTDLEDAISRQRDAVDLTPHGHPQKPRYLNELGTSLVTRFMHLGQLTDLEDAISRQRGAVDLTPHGHTLKPLYLNSLGTSLVIRFERLGQLTDLEDGISNQRDAVDLTPHGEPTYLHNLGVSLITRFKHLGKLADLEDAISRQRDAVDLIPHGHPDKPQGLYTLGNSFLTRFERFGEPSDLEHAISLFSHATSSPLGPINFRFHASQKWVSCARRIRHHSLLHAYSIALSLLPQLAWIGLSLKDRYDALLGDADIVREAAAGALDAGLPGVAVELLEQGRSIIWGELFQLRSSYEELSSTYPDHARRLCELSAELDQASGTHENSLSGLLERTRDRAHYITEYPRQEADRHRALAIERDNLLQEIRRLPGCNQFLRRKQFSHLRASAHSGPVVILNAAETRCDALVVLADLDHVIHIPLTNLTFNQSTHLQNTMKNFVHEARAGRGARPVRDSWESILSALWTNVVKPVIDALAFSTPAGLYGTQHSLPGHKLSDFLISSYIPTLSILSPLSNPRTPPSSDLRVLAVRQPPSDGLPPLLDVGPELEHIREVIGNSPSAQTTLVESSEGTVEEVLSLMNEADWVHFACHGVQDGIDSGLCLSDGRRLKLRDMIALQRPRGGLAFLSACQTAQGDKDLSDEAIHMAAGMLFAGYGGVVGTMWSISDHLAPEVARDVYAHLFRDGTRPDYRDAARALHEAIGRARREGASSSTWIPFIHLGL
ncbi:CHAT domain containing protein [Tylopilus felleus]